jgi:hypothetical protein
MTLPATPGNPVVGVLTYQTLQIPGTLDDWIGPPFDRSNPQAFNAYLTPAGYGTTLLTPWNLKNDFRIISPGYGDITDAHVAARCLEGSSVRFERLPVCWVHQLTDSVLPGHLEHRLSTALPPSWTTTSVT